MRSAVGWNDAENAGIFVQDNRVAGRLQNLELIGNGEGSWSGDWHAIRESAGVVGSANDAIFLHAWLQLGPGGSRASTTSGSSASSTRRSAAAEAIDSRKIGLAVRQPGHVSLGFRSGSSAGIHRCGSGDGYGDFLRHYSVVWPGDGQCVRGGGFRIYLPAAARCYLADFRADGHRIRILCRPNQRDRLAGLNALWLRAKLGDPRRRLHAWWPRGRRWRGCLRQGQGNRYQSDQREAHCRFLFLGLLLFEELAVVVIVLADELVYFGEIRTQREAARDGPGLHENVGILHGSLVVQIVQIGAMEAFDHVQRFGVFVAPREFGFVVEPNSVDD